MQCGLLIVVSVLWSLPTMMVSAWWLRGVGHAPVLRLGWLLSRKIAYPKKPDIKYTDRRFTMRETRRETMRETTREQWLRNWLSEHSNHAERVAERQAGRLCLGSPLQHSTMEVVLTAVMRLWLAPSRSCAARSRIKHAFSCSCSCSVWIWRSTGLAPYVRGSAARDEQKLLCII